jgi:hypothetical protein
MKQTRPIKSLSMLAAIAALFLSHAAFGQQVVFTENFDSPDSANNWTVNAASSNDTADFAFDYSTVGIPPAPNSSGTTLGLLLRANRPLSAGALTGVSVSPNGQDFTGSYILEFDLWENYPGPAPAGGAGSTQMTGAGIMTSGTVPHYAGSGDGLWFTATGDGGSSIDYRVYFRGLNQTSAALYPAGGQNQTAAYYQTNFPGGVSAPAAQLALFPSQTGTTAAGTIGWAWHHVKITKSGSFVTWDVDNIRVANVDLTDSSVPEFGGDNILFSQADINAGQTTTALDPLLFGLIDNVKVTALPSEEVTATVDVDTLAEANTAAVAAITIARPADNTTNDLAVNFTLGGTATRGADATTGDYYLRTNGVAIATANSVTIPAGSDHVVLEIVPNDDNVAELSETINFRLAGSPNYSPGTPSGGAITIQDNDTPTVDISAVVFNQMFEANTNDLIRFTLERRGDLNAASFDVNLAYAGTATAGQDYTPVQSVTFNPGDVTQTLDIHPLNDSATEDRETVIVSVATGAGYSIGTNNVLTAGATGVIVDDDVPEGTVLFSDNFDTDSSAAWKILFGSLDPDSQDYSATFAFDYGQQGFGLPPAPHSTNGTTLGLLVTVNKLDALAEAAGVNLYPIGKDFSGNYALRFDMYLMQNAGVGTTENAMFGINHDTTHTNWYSNSGVGVTADAAFDGVWASVVTDASVLSNPFAHDYQLFTAPAKTVSGIYGPTLVTNRDAVTLTNVFHQPPWTSGGGAGSPGNIPSSTTPSWAEVELMQTNGVITLTINNTNIFTYTNTTASTHGDIMLGYDDAFDSIGSGEGMVIFDNVRVVDLGGVAQGPIHISSITANGNNVQIDFTAGNGEATSAFKLVSATTVTGPYVDDNTATITSLGGSNYRVTTTATDAMRFYQIRRAP